MTKLFARLFRRLLPGPIGEEAARDLEDELARRRKGNRFGAGLWYVAQLLHPNMWTLARALRRETRGQARSSSGGGVSWLDVKLGLRMLRKHPSMTLVSGLAISVTIAVALGMFSFFQDFLMRPTLPLPEGDRIVSLGLLNTETNRSDWRLLHDFEIWRDELETVEELSIWRNDARNIVGADGRGELAPFAMMSASGFDLARVAPLLGRPLLASDEIDGAPPVLVVGYAEWLSRFGGDPGIVGEQVRIGREDHTIVGVMPEGFTFPVAHRFWIPFRDDADDRPLLEGPNYYVFGRLAPGVDEAEAQVELSVLSSRRATELPATHARLVGQVMSYTDPHTGMDNASGSNLIARAVLAVFSLIVLIPFANVAILIYARTATRVGEIAVRTAIGASRRRIVAQLFVEALVLASLSAAAGVGLALVVLGQVDRFLDTYLSSGMPFWAKSGKDPWAIAYVVGITVLAAVVAGVVPGLRATGKGVQKTLRAAGSSGMRLGRVWTTLAVTQVAITVAFLPLAGSVARQALSIGTAEPTFPAGEYLGAVVSGAAVRALGDRGDVEDQTEAVQELVRRLEADARVTGVALTTRLPGSPYSADTRIDVEGIDPHASGRGYPVGTTTMSANLFEILGVALTGGRGFDRAEAEAEARPVVVDESFVREVLHGGSPLGRRIRVYRGPDAEPAPWSEIVGVVRDLVDNPMSRQEVAGMVYFPLRSAEVADGVRLIVHASSSPESLAPMIQRIATEIDPTLPVSSITPLDGWGNPLRAVMLGATVVMALVLLSVLLLCSAGVFALMSFNVTQRRREIGIRSALGASPERVLAKVMARSARQLGLGVTVGVLLVAIMPDLELDGLLVEIDAGLIAAVAVLLVLVGLIASAGPARAGLRVQPTEALRES